jgi:hypothetical protein
MRHARISGAAIVTTVLSILLVLGGGGIIYASSPTCQRFVKTFVTVPVRNRVSKRTSDAWAKWRVGHPNWKPNPKVQRPKYVMSRKEALEKVTFACEATTVPSTLDMQLPPIELGDLPPLIALTPVVGLPPGIGFPPGSGLPPIETTQVIYPGLIPPAVVDVPPIGSPGAPGAPGGGGGGVPVFFIPPVPLPPPIPGGGGGSTTTTGSTPVTPPVVPPIVPPVVPPVTPPTISGVPEPPSFWLVALGVAAPCALFGRRLKKSKRRRDS